MTQVKIAGVCPKVCLKIPFLATDVCLKALMTCHDPVLDIASTRDGTLKLREGAHGLHAQITLPDDEVGRRVAKWVRQGVMTGMSFGFKPETLKHRWTTFNGYWGRELLDVDLVEVSGHITARVSCNVGASGEKPFANRHGRIEGSVSIHERKIFGAVVNATRWCKYLAKDSISHKSWGQIKCYLYKKTFHT